MTAAIRSNERWSGSSLKNRVQVVQRQKTHGGSRLDRGATDVWQQESILERQIPRIQTRFAFERVQSRRCDMTALKGGDEILIQSRDTKSLNRYFPELIET